MEETLQYIKADFHVHTSFSRRVTASPEEMYAAAREKGLVRSEGKDYVVQDGDTILFRFNV